MGFRDVLSYELKVYAMRMQCKVKGSSLVADVLVSYRIYRGR